MLLAATLFAVHVMDNAYAPDRRCAEGAGEVCPGSYDVLEGVIALTGGLTLASGVYGFVVRDRCGKQAAT